MTQRKNTLTIKNKTYDLTDPDSPALEIYNKVQDRLSKVQFANPMDASLWEQDEYIAWYDAGEPTGDTLRQYISERWGPPEQEITPGPTVPKSEEIAASEEVINHKWNLEEATKIYKEARKQFVEKHIESEPGKPNQVRKREDSELWSQPRYKNSGSRWPRVFKREASQVAIDAVKAWALEQSIWKASGLSDDKIQFLEIGVAWRKVHWIEHPMFKEPLPSVKPTEETKAENADTPPQEVRAPQVIKGQEKASPPPASAKTESAASQASDQSVISIDEKSYIYDDLIYEIDENDAAGNLKNAIVASKKINDVFNTELGRIAIMSYRSAAKFGLTSDQVLKAEVMAEMNEWVNAGMPSPVLDSSFMGFGVIKPEDHIINQDDWFEVRYASAALKERYSLKQKEAPAEKPAEISEETEEQIGETQATQSEQESTPAPAEEEQQTSEKPPQTSPESVDSPIKEEPEPEVKNVIHFAGRPNVRTGDIIQDWTKSRIDKHRPFFDSVKQEYLLSWKTEHVGTGGEETSEKYQLQARELKKEGCKWLLDFFFKQYDDELLTKLAKVSNHEYYIKDRPKSKIKVLVKVPARYFDAIVTKEEDYAWDSDEVTKRRVTLLSSDLEKDIETVVEELQSYDDIIKNSGARIAPGPHSDPNLQDKYFISYKSDLTPDLYKLWEGLQQIFKHNNLEIRKDKEDIIEIGFSQGFRKITYILYGSSDDETIEMLPLRFGFNAFEYLLHRKRSESRTFRTGNGLLFYLSDAIEYLKNNPSSDRWLEFTQKYINPSVLIYPAGATEALRPPGAEEEIELQKATDESAEDTPYVTTEEKKAEDSVVNDQEVRKKIADKRDKEKDPVGPAPVKPPKNVEESYDKKYNKVDHRRTARAAMICLLKIMPDSEVKAAFENNILITNPNFNYKQPGARSKMVGTACPSMKQSAPSTKRKRPKSQLPNLDKITFTFPDSSPIVSDTLVWEAKQLEYSMQRTLKTLVKIAEFPLSVCENIDNLLNQFNNLLNQFDRLRDAICRELQAKLGLQPGHCPDPFVDDMMRSMTDQELKDLFDGNPSNDSLDHLSGLLSDHDLPISPDFFFGMPNNIEPLGCVPSFDSIACPDQFFDNLINQRKKLLAKGGTTDDQINKQLLKEKQDRINGLKKLADLINSDNLDHLVPPMDPCSEEEALRELSEDLNESGFTSPASSLAPKQPESIDYMTNKVIDQIYSQTEQAFDSDCRAYVESLVQTAEESKEKISLYKLNEERTDFENDPKEPINDPQTQKDGQFPSEDYDPKKNYVRDDTLVVHTDNKEMVRSQKILPHLKSSLQNFSNDLVVYGNSPFVLGAAHYNIGASVKGLSGPIITYSTNEANQQKKELDTSALHVSEVISAPITGYDQDAENVEDMAIYGSPIINESIYTSKSTVTTQQKIEELDIKPDSFESSPQAQVFSKMLLKNIPSEIMDNNILVRPKLERIWPRNYAEYQDYFAELISEAKFFEMGHLEKISLVPPSPAEREIAPCSGRPNNSLLDLNGIKSKVKQTYTEELDCSKSPTSDDQSKSMSPLESAGAEGAVYTIIRLFAVEVLLNSAPVFSVFNAEDIARDDMFLSFALKKINDSLRVFDPVFYDELASFALKTLNKRKEKQGELKDPVTEKETSLSAGIDAIKFIIKEQLLAVSDDIDNIFGPEESASSLIKDKILNEWIGPEQTIPEVDYNDATGRYTTQPRFSKVEHGGQLKGLDLHQEEDLRIFKNGQFFLEKYFKIEEKDGVSAFDSEIPKYLKGVVNIKQWQEWAKWNIKEGFENTHIDTKLNIKMGVRLMYLPPTEGSPWKTTYEIIMGLGQVDGYEGLDGEWVPAELVWEEVNEGAFSFTADSLFPGKTLNDPVALQNMAYAITELRSGSREDVSTEADTLYVERDIERVVNPIPIIVVEKSAHEVLAKAGIENFGDLKDNEIDWTRITIENNPTRDWYSPESIEIISEFLALKEELKKSEEFEIIFGYCYNMSRLSSLFTIYCTTVTKSSNPAIKAAFDPTKESLKNLFYMLINSSDVKPYYSFKNPVSAEHGTNAQMKSSVNNVMSTDGPVGFSAATRMAANTIPMMIKGYAERSDPSIRLMKQLGHPTVWSSVPKVLPMNVFGPPPFGIGIGPPLTPRGFLALSLNFKTPYEKYRERNKQENNYLEQQGEIVPEEECNVPENEQEETE